MAGQFMRGEPRPVAVLFANAKSANEGDLIATDASTQAGYKASEQTWDTDLATTRAAFVLRFAGAANQATDAGDPVRGMSGFAGRMLIHTGGVRAFACKAGTYLTGQLVGPAKQTGNFLEDQILEGVASQAQAIGIIVGNGGVNPAEIEVELLSAVFPSARQ